MARQLDEFGLPVTLLAMIDVFRPRSYELAKRRPTWKMPLLHEMQRIRNHWMNFTWRDRSRRWSCVRDVTHTAWQRLVWKITTGGGDNRAREIQCVSRTNRQALASHVHKTTCVPVTLFRCRAQPPGRRKSWAMVWEELAKGGIIVYDVSDYHGELCRGPYCRHRIELLAAALHETDPEVGNACSANMKPSC